jgi:hypothetical protein
MNANKDRVLRFTAYCKTTCKPGGGCAARKGTETGAAGGLSWAELEKACPQWAGIKAAEARAASKAAQTAEARDTATILAALRFYQADGRAACMAGVSEIATGGGTLKEMTADEIDGLCERINTGGVRVV